MYVPTKFQIHTASEMAEFTKTFDETNPLWSDLLVLDYFYNHHMPEYDGGLSFIDRLVKKLGFRHKYWNADLIKSIINASEDKVATYLEIIQEMLEKEEDIACYGI
jgi:hypothetical protein